MMTPLSRRASATLLLALCAAPAFASQYSNGNGVTSQGVVPESAPGVPIGPASPMTVRNGGSAGSDASANPIALPTIGGTVGSSIFGGPSPYAAYVLIDVVPANATRASIEICNTTGEPIAYLRDDGTAASGSAPTNGTVFPLDAGVANGRQGGCWSSTTFKGRLSVYAPTATDYVPVTQD